MERRYETPVARTVRELRQALGLSFPQMAYRWGISVSMAFGIEKGSNQNPGWEILQKLVTNFGVDPAVLFHTKGVRDAREEAAKRAKR